MAPLLSSHDVVIRGLSPAHDGLVVAHLSDVHVGLLTPEARIRRAVAMANDARPDVVLLTGDYVCYARKFVPLMGELLGGLSARHAVVASLGNHDHWTDAEGVTRVLERRGFNVLRNQNLALHPRGMRLTLVGIDDAVTAHDDTERAFAGVRPAGEGTVVALTHCPELAPRAAAAGAHLIVGGHTHGGQVHVRSVTELIHRRLTRRRYLSGWYQVQGAMLYVNRGLGSSSIPVRAGAGARAEVAIFRLHAA